MKLEVPGFLTSVWTPDTDMSYHPKSRLDTVRTDIRRFNEGHDEQSFEDVCYDDTYRKIEKVKRFTFLFTTL